ncbi:cytochrome c oxidase subunit 4 [Rathayibacter soli]|uniref:cytochrome c oxidase subunit 4 n=1 Tax=Rathayibacter soli TaxID=3144168 RepID=UPI0027E574B6|nr:cytochrome c oxidase subunit 4 [Glaciibacter superstes]
MKASSVIFWIIAAFFWTVAAIYTVWALIYYHGRVEWVGTIALGLTGILGAFIGFYLGRSYASQGGPLPEDRVDGNIDDGDPELGHFSPWSWWPMLLAGSVGIMALGLAVGFWLCYIAVPLALICLVGWVFEYYRGYFAR